MYSPIVPHRWQRVTTRIVPSPTRPDVIVKCRDAGSECSPKLLHLCARRLRRTSVHGMRDRWRASDIGETMRIGRAGVDDIGAVLVVQPALRGVEWEHSWSGVVLCAR